MSKREIKAGSVDQTTDVFIQDSSSLTGAGLANLTNASAGLVCYYRKGATGTPTQLSLVSNGVGSAHTDGGFVQVSAANMPGVYRLDLSDTMVASAGMLTVYLQGAANMAPCVAEIEVVAVDKFDATRGGLAALPNAAANADGGLPVLSASGTTLAYTLSTLTTYTGNTPQTGDAFARVGAAGAGLTALGDARLANLDAAVTSRMATYAQPAGFLAAAFPATVAGTTNITAASGVTLTSGERTAIANEVEAQIIDETDSEKVLTAITDKIASVNPSLSGLTLAAIAAAVRDVANAAPSAGSLGEAVNAAQRSGVAVTLPANPPAGFLVAASYGTAPAWFTGYATASALASLQTHGDAAWGTATGFATAADLTALQTHGDASWATAAGFAVAGDPMTLADGAITDAKFTAVEPSGPATGIVSQIRQLWRRFFGRARKDGTTVKTYAANATSVVTTQSYTSSGGTDDIGAAT